MAEKFEEILKQRFSRRGVSNVTGTIASKRKESDLNKKALESSKEAKRLRKAGSSQKVINRRLKIAREIAQKARRMKDILDKKR